MTTPVEPRDAGQAGPVVDLSFPVRGSEIRSDHAYALYAAVSRLVPRWHGLPGGMAPIRGIDDGRGRRALAGTAWLRFRLPAEHIGLLLPLAGKTLDLHGDRLFLGVPRVRALRPAAALVARLTTIKGFMEPEPFRDACARQLAALGVAGKLAVGPRGVVRVRDRKVVGFRTLVTELTAEESIALQEHGLGGRRKLGCGMFGGARMEAGG
ncbi:MAG: type I-MYXAN CRISPR-associated protein Cas6/Cmx6 [Deltaproteobacteria bacterium]|nr:type I-MYXAN CRISPR-associated protein Cas6/Cmx6 [Deltaproteobacteria bacterium]